MDTIVISNLVKIQRIQSGIDPVFAELVRIYIESHPESERKPASLLSSMIMRPEYLFLVAIQDKLVVGFSITLCFLKSDAALLEYMAVAPNRRGQGIGQNLFKETVKFEKASERFILAEVDSDKRQMADITDRTRRKNFYRRLGCREIDGLSYIMPPVSNSKPPAMDLLVYRRELPKTVEKKHLRAWLESCYIQVYGMTASDSRIDRMLRNLPKHLRLI
ncbi:MAG: GNAT family N-acetyltransferase [Terracidiphilus sp.]|jgi:ribosomal protein S18 acetylase RimI-like enzyme